jgi:UEV domain
VQVLNVVSTLCCQFSPSTVQDDSALVCLQNGQFNIPVEIVLPPDFPVAAPDVFVRPTESMVVASNHPFVEVNTGAVNTPSIVSWTFPRSNLTSCLTELSAEFGTQSPVYARPAGSTQPPQAQPAATLFPYSAEAQQPAQLDYMFNPLRPGTNPSPPGRPADQSRFPV